MSVLYTLEPREADSADAQPGSEVTRWSRWRYNKIKNICCRASAPEADSAAAVLLRLAAKPLTRFHLAIHSPLTVETENLTFTPPTGHPMRARTNASFPQDHTQEIYT
jgi:hypothetical protein